MATYDDDTWHTGSGEYPEGLAPDRAYTHIALYLAWIGERDLGSESFTKGFVAPRETLEAFRAGEASFADFASKLREAVGGALTSEQLGELGDAFTAEYYEEVYPGDWESTVFYDEAETPYHVEPTPEHLAELFERLDEQRLAWESGEWGDEVYEGTIRLWDLSDNEQLVGTPGEIAVVSPDGLRMAAGDIDGQITIYEVASGGVLGYLQGHEGPLSALIFSDDGSQIASAGVDATVRVWNAETGEELITFEGSEEIVSSLAFTPDGKRLLTVGHPLEAYLDQDALDSYLDEELEGEEDLMLAGEDAEEDAEEGAEDDAV